MDKLVEHGIRMLEIVEGENDFFRNDAKRQADIARAVYDTILRVQALERKADRKTESNSEKPNNCEYITEDGVTCAKYPACDDCLDNPLNKVKGSERLVKGSEQTEPTISKMEQVDEPKTQMKTQNSNLTFEKTDEPQTYVINPQEPTNDDKCFECDDFFTCGGQCNKIEDEPQTDCAWK